MLRRRQSFGFLEGKTKVGGKADSKTWHQLWVCLHQKYGNTIWGRPYLRTWLEVISDTAPIRKRVTTSLSQATTSISLIWWSWNQVGTILCEHAGFHPFDNMLNMVCLASTADAATHVARLYRRMFPAGNFQPDSVGTAKFGADTMMSFVGG